MLAFSFPLLLFIRLVLNFQIHPAKPDFSSFKTTFWNFSQEIFKVVVYCLIIKVLCCCSLATAILDYHIFRRLSTTFSFLFFIFFKTSFYSFEFFSITYLRQLLILSPFIFNVNPFFTFFRHFYDQWFINFISCNFK